MDSSRLKHSELAEHLLEFLRTSRATRRPNIWTRLPRNLRPAKWAKIDDPLFSLESKLYGHPLAGLLWERKLEELLLQEIWEHFKSWECL